MDVKYDSVACIDYGRECLITAVNRHHLAAPMVPPVRSQKLKSGNRIKSIAIGIRSLCYQLRENIPGVNEYIESISDRGSSNVYTPRTEWEGVRKIDQEGLRIERWTSATFSRSKRF